MVFALAVVVGFYVICNVAPRPAHAADERDQRDLAASSWSAPCCRSGTASLVDHVLAFVAVLVASINVFGGFL